MESSTTGPQEGLKIQEEGGGEGGSRVVARHNLHPLIEKGLTYLPKSGNSPTALNK